MAPAPLPAFEIPIRNRPDDAPSVRANNLPPEHIPTIFEVGKIAAAGGWQGREVYSEPGIKGNGGRVRVGLSGKLSIDILRIRIGQQDAPGRNGHLSGCSAVGLPFAGTDAYQGTIRVGEVFIQDNCCGTGTGEEQQGNKDNYNLHRNDLPENELGTEGK